MSFSAIVLFALAIGAALMLPVAGVWLAINLVRLLTWTCTGLASALGWVFRSIFRFIGGMVSDSAQAVGHLVTAVFTLPLMVANVPLLRFKAVGHYGRALEDAFYGLVICLYRVVIGHPLRLVGLGALTESIEVGTPNLFADEPRTAPAVPRHHVPQDGGPSPRFEGYKIQEELRAGGSGARLFLARPTSSKSRDLAARGLEVPDQVVIKAFDRRFGSTVPQIVRESRALEAARGLGLVVEHVTTEDAFHYVMPFVPGHDLDVETARLHERSGSGGLGREELSLVLGYARDLCHHLSRFHEGGLWHKDVKPSNLLVSDGRLRVVDFGLVTPLESALTLTTHGTEFFRDPELVRLALAGKRVQDVDGVKFDLYSAGAVLYSMVENSFPAHGSLSSINKEAPEGLRWIVRRSMADVDKRYASAREMLSDVEALLAAADPYALPLAALPSVSGAAPSPGREAVSEDPGQEQPSGDGPDVRRFSAFGLTAEITGLGAAKQSLSGARETLAAKRASLAERRESDRERRQEEAEARSAARAEAKVARRNRRRGALRGFATVAVVAVIALGAYEQWEHQASSRWVPETESMASPLTPIPAVPRMPAGSRVLLITDPDDLSLNEASLAYAARLETEGVVPLGTRLEDTEGISLLSNARYALETAGSSRKVQCQALQNLIQESGGLDGIHRLERNERGELTVLWLDGNLEVNAVLQDGLIHGSSAPTDDEGAIRGVIEAPEAPSGRSPGDGSKRRP